MKPEDARSKEAEIHESFRGLRQRLARDDSEPTPEEDGRTIYRELCKVGRFWRSLDARVYYVRYSDGDSYRVGSSPKLRFAKFTARLLDLDSRSRRVREALDHLTQHVREDAPVILLDIPAFSQSPEPWRGPLRFAAKKKLKARGPRVLWRGLRVVR
jgi:hypothetical protein